MERDPILSSLLSSARDADEHSLAVRYAPVIYFDRHEPFLPLAAGYSIVRSNIPSPSFTRGREINLRANGQPAASFAIEYAIWWDWDIGHLYELEHVWVFVNEAGRVVRAEASWHGDYHDMSQDEHLALEGDHLIVYSQPGKHAFAPTPHWFREREKQVRRSETRDLAGLGGVLLSPFIKDRVKVSPFDTLLVRTYLAHHAFEPSWDFSQVFRFTPEMLVPWPALRDWMPSRVTQCMDQLRRELPTSDYRFLRIGHRGAAAHAPGNTVMALREAAARAADMVEFDVRRTADGHIVLAHDSYLTDTTGRVWPIATSSLAHLQTIDLGKGQHVPTLADALAICQQEYMGAYIEVKDGAAIPAVVAALRQQRATDRCIIGSFRPDWLANIKKVAPELTTSILFSSPHLSAVELAHSIAATYVHPCWEWAVAPSSLLTPEWLTAVRTADLGVICWHEERPQEIAALRCIGVDGICSNAPELLL